MTEEIKDILDLLQYNDHINTNNKRKLRNYITNLQHTKEYLGEVLHEQDLELEKLKQENEDLKGRLENAVADCNLRLQEFKDYKSRKEKVVEYLDKHKIKLSHSFDEPDCDYWIATNPQDIIDILNGKE